MNIYTVLVLLTRINYREKLERLSSYLFLVYPSCNLTFQAINNYGNKIVKQDTHKDIKRKHPNLSTRRAIGSIKAVEKIYL